MKLKTAVTLIKSGRLLLLLRLKSLYSSFYRMCFLASMADSVFLERLVKGPVSVEELTKGCRGDTFIQNMAQAWLDIGLQLGLLKKNRAGYSLRGFLARKFAAPENDAIRALVREVAELHHLYIIKTPSRWKRGSLGARMTSTVNMEM